VTLFVSLFSVFSWSFPFYLFCVIIIFIAERRPIKDGEGNNFLLLFLDTLYLVLGRDWLFFLLVTMILSCSCFPAVQQSFPFQHNCLRFWYIIHFGSFVLVAPSFFIRFFLTNSL
jgi:hypothetical protein